MGPSTTGGWGCASRFVSFGSASCCWRPASPEERRSRPTRFPSRSAPGPGGCFAATRRSSARSSRPRRAAACARGRPGSSSSWASERVASSSAGAWNDGCPCPFPAIRATGPRTWRSTAGRRRSAPPTGVPPSSSARASIACRGASAGTRCRSCSRFPRRPRCSPSSSRARRGGRPSPHPSATSRVGSGSGSGAVTTARRVGWRSSSTGGSWTPFPSGSRPASRSRSPAAVARWCWGARCRRASWPWTCAARFPRASTRTAACVSRCARDASRSISTRATRGRWTGSLRWSPGVPGRPARSGCSPRDPTCASSPSPAARRSIPSRPTCPPSGRACPPICCTPETRSCSARSVGAMRSRPRTCSPSSAAGGSTSTGVATRSRIGSRVRSDAAAASRWTPPPTWVASP